ncbi:hypothetical protein N2152v2_005156 [Parachlorella kessleri]
MDVMLTHFFIQGLSSDIRDFVMVRRPASFEEAVSEGEFYEDNFLKSVPTGDKREAVKREGVLSNSNRRSGPAIFRRPAPVAAEDNKVSIDALSKQLGRLSLQLAQLPVNHANFGPRENGPIKCFNCGQTGHRARECPNHPNVNYMEMNFEGSGSEAEYEDSDDNYDDYEEASGDAYEAYHYYSPEIYAQEKRAREELRDQAPAPRRFRPVTVDHGNLPDAPRPRMAPTRQQTGPTSRPAAGPPPVASRPAPRAAAPPTTGPTTNQARPRMPVRVAAPSSAPGYDVAAQLESTPAKVSVMQLLRMCPPAYTQFKHAVEGAGGRVQKPATEGRNAAAKVNLCETEDALDPLSRYLPDHEYSGQHEDPTYHVYSEDLPPPRPNNMPVNAGTPSVVRIHCKVFDLPVVAIVDSGASTSVLSQTVLRKIQRHRQLETTSTTFLTASGQREKPWGILRDVMVSVGRLTLSMDIPVVGAKNYDLLLGNDWLLQSACHMFWDARKLRIMISPTDYDEVDFDVEGKLRAPHALAPHEDSATYSHRAVRDPFEGLWREQLAQTVHLLDRQASNSPPSRLPVPQDLRGADPSHLPAPQDTRQEEPSHHIPIPISLPPVKVKARDESPERLRVIISSPTTTLDSNGEVIFKKNRKRYSGNFPRAICVPGPARDEELAMNEQLNRSLAKMREEDRQRPPPPPQVELPALNSPSHPRYHSPDYSFTMSERAFFPPGRPLLADPPELRSDSDGELESSRPSKRQSAAADEGPQSDWEKVSNLKIGDHLPPHLQEQVQELLYHNLDVFAWSHLELGCTPLLKHSINTGDAKPIALRPYRHSLKEQEIERQEIEKLLEAGLLEPCSGPWCFPTLLVKKPKQKESDPDRWRMVIDVRALNKVTVRDETLLPLIDDTFLQLGGAKVFSKLDLMQGFHQVELDEESRDKCAIVTRTMGLFRYTRMPMGLVNAPATFQKLVNQVFYGMHDRVLPYLDDIIIFSKDVDSHLYHLEEVFERLREAGLTVAPWKCHFLCAEIEFLGHVVDANGSRPMPSKVECIQKLAPPRDIRAVRSFLGMVGYYRRFIRSYSDRARPLVELLKKDIPWEWTEECQAAFEDLRQCLMTAPILVRPTPHGKFILACDVSGYACAAILSQVEEDGLEHPVGYSSRVLTKAERNYSSTEAELLACLYGVQQYRHLLHAVHFTLVTDHQALKWLLTASGKALTGRAARWALLFQEYTFDVVYRPGNKHTNCDSLSRLQQLEEEDQDTPSAEAQARVATQREVHLLSSVGNAGAHPRPPSLPCQYWESCVGQDEECPAAYQDRLGDESPYSGSQCSSYTSWGSEDSGGNGPVMELYFLGSDASDDVPSDLPCQVCQDSDAWHLMLICDGCGKGFHTYCLQPPLRAIPAGTWHCQRCLDHRAVPPNQPQQREHGDQEEDPPEVEGSEGQNPPSSEGLLPELGGPWDEEEEEPWRAPLDDQDEGWGILGQDNHGEEPATSEQEGGEILAGDEEGEGEPQADQGAIKEACITLDANVCNFLASGMLPDHLSKAEKARVRRRARLYTWKGGVVYRKPTEDYGERQVPPIESRPRIILRFHEMAHQGQKRTVETLQRYYWWRGLHRDVREVIAACTTCQRAAPTLVEPPGLKPVKVTELGERVWGDICGPYPPSYPLGNRYICVFVEGASRHIFCYPLKTQDSATVAASASHLFGIIGYPKYFQSDQGGCFVGSPFQSLLRRYNIIHRRSSAYNPQAGGCVERAVQTVTKQLRKMCVQRDATMWEAYLGQIVGQYNSTTQASTKLAPAMVLFGRLPRLPLHVVLQPHAPEQVSQSEDSSGPSEPASLDADVGERLAAQQARVQEALSNLRKAQQKQVQRYAERKGLDGVQIQLVEGQKVLCAEHAPENKLSAQSEGPYIIKYFKNGGRECVLMDAYENTWRVSTKHVRPFIEHPQEWRWQPIGAVTADEPNPEATRDEATVDLTGLEDSPSPTDPGAGPSTTPSNTDETETEDCHPSNDPGLDHDPYNKVKPRLRGNQAFRGTPKSWQKGQVPRRRRSSSPGGQSHDGRPKKRRRKSSTPVKRQRHGVHPTGGAVNDDGEIPAAEGAPVRRSSRPPKPKAASPELPRPWERVKLPNISTQGKNKKKTARRAHIATPATKQPANPHHSEQAYLITGQSFTYSTHLLAGDASQSSSLEKHIDSAAALQRSLQDMCSVLSTRRGQKLRPLDCCDLACILGQITDSTALRRSAMMSLGDPWDTDYLLAKRYGHRDVPNWRCYANFTVVCEDLSALAPEYWLPFEEGGECFGLANLKLCQSHGRLMDLPVEDAEILGLNPCSEQPLANRQICQLAEIMLPRIESLAELLQAGRLLYRMCKHTLQLQCFESTSQAVVQRKQHMGVSVSGYLSATEQQKSWLPRLYKELWRYDKEYSAQLGSPPCRKLTTVKPSGTLSSLCNPAMTHGWHPAHFHQGIRRVRFSSSNPLVAVCAAHGYPVEHAQRLDGSTVPTCSIVSFPLEYPATAKLARDMTAVEQLEVVRRLQTEYSDNAVSSTVLFYPKELPAVIDWLQANYSTCLKTISFLQRGEQDWWPQMPFQELPRQDFETFKAAVTPLARSPIQVVGADPATPDLEDVQGAVLMPPKGLRTIRIKMGERPR